MEKPVTDGGYGREGAERGLAEARRILSADPNNQEAVRILEQSLRALGHADWKDRADRMRRSLKHPRLQEAAKLLTEGKLGQAERVLRPYLEANPRDTSGLRLMADLAERIGRPRDAEGLLRRALSIEPTYISARYDLASLLTRELKLAEAVEQIDQLLEQQPGRLEFLVLKATTLERLGRNEEALSTFAEAARLHPSDPSVWVKAGHVSRTVGRLDESVQAYRRALAIAPGMGVAWWSLANLKIGVLAREDIDAMVVALGRDELTPDDRLHIHFALGKATEDLGSHREAFSHYSEANRLRRSTREYRPEEITTFVDRSVALFGSGFAQSLAASSPAGGPTPIFIVGMPRSGSTLCEQILATHSAVEGTAELHYMPRIAARLGFGRAESDYPAAVALPGRLPAAEMSQEYIEGLKSHCRLDRPMAIDKNPNNWIHIGLILRLLPTAKIIDVRRNPLDCGISNFRQHFAQGQGFAYSLDSFGRYYRDYVRMLDHWDALLPGRIHRVVYEELVEDIEANVRRLLAYLGLPFEAACLEFYRNDRAVRTPSSEQVRRPINRHGIGQWRSFDPWIGELKAALGPLLSNGAAGGSGGTQVATEN